jgi:hypothetical protein
LIENFENEYKQMENFIVEKKDEQKYTNKKNRWDRTKQKINQGGDESKEYAISP